MNYRKLWESFNGHIPVDEEGRSYEIHHIDGNRKNNSIENLLAVSIEDHFNIHLNQGDYEAAGLIADRLGLTDSELTELRLKGSPKPLLECPYCNKVGGRPQMLQWHFDNCASKTGVKLTRKKYKCKICSKEIGGASNLIQHERSCKLKLSKEPLICPHCGFEGKPHSNMERWHFDNCRIFTNIKRTLTEEHKRNLRKPKTKKKL